MIFIDSIFSESVGYLYWLHRLRVLLPPLPYYRPQIGSLQLLVRVVILEEAGTAGIAGDQPDDDPLPEVEDQYAGILRLEHHGRADQEDDADYNVLDVVARLLQEPQVRAGLLVFVEDGEGVAVEVEHGEEVEEAEEVYKRAGGRVHEDDSEDEDVEGVEVAVSEGVVGSVFALMTHQGVLLVGEVGIEDLDHKIACLEQHGEDRESRLVYDEAIVEEPIGLPVDEREELQPAPSSGHNISKIQSVPNNRPSQHIDDEEDEQDLHLLLVPIVLEVLALPLRGLGDESAEDGVDDAQHGRQQDGGDVEDRSGPREHHNHDADHYQHQGQYIHEYVLHLLHLLRGVDADPTNIVGLLRPVH